MPRKTKQVTDAPTVTWENSHFYHKGKEFIPKVFDLKELGEEVPAGYNAVKISIDGRVSSSLNWKEIKKAAAEYTKKGLLILWDLNLGLFSELSFSLTNETQYRSLCISLEHFLESLWNEFQDQTLGLCLYQGEVDFTSLPWDEELDHNLQEWLHDCFQNVETFNGETGCLIHDFAEADHTFLSATNDLTRQLLRLFCRDVAVEYLHILIETLPQGLLAFILLDCEKVENPIFLAELLNKECFDRMHLAIKNCSLCLEDLAWEEGKSSAGFIAHKKIPTPKEKEVSVGVCLPPAGLYRPTAYAGLGRALRWLNKEEVSYKIISERMLTTEWDGLDSLLVVPSGVTNSGRRMLEGFCAAGGTVVTVTDVEIGLPFEVTLSEWKKYRDQF